MNEKAIALTVFFVSVFLLYQIRFIVRLGKLRKNRGNVTEKGFILGAYDLFGCFDCCCSLGCNCAICAAESTHTEYERQTKKREIKKSDEFEQKDKERRRIEKEKYLFELEKEKIERKKRVEVLRTSGYTATDEERNKVIEIVSINPKTGLSWTSKTSRLQLEKIIIIIEHEPDFEIKGEYIINKKKIQEKEEKIKIAKITCPNCENLFELGSDFCPNCGDTLET